MTHVSLFSGMGGLDLAAEWAGFETILQVEKDFAARNVLQRHWRSVPKIKRVENVTSETFNRPVTLVSGGDPCPVRSRARGSRPTKHPDLSGHFLAVVGCCRARWVVRENVPAPDVVDFEAALDVLGYRAVIVETNALEATRQRREREFVVGCYSSAKMREFLDVYDTQGAEGNYSTDDKEAPFVPCLTTHPKRYNDNSGYVYEGTLRVLDSSEREGVAGFPSGWLEGIGHYTVARLTGNAVVPQQVYPIMKAIAECELTQQPK